MLIKYSLTIVRVSERQIPMSLGHTLVTKKSTWVMQIETGLLLNDMGRKVQGSSLALTLLMQEGKLHLGAGSKT